MRKLWISVGSIAALLSSGAAASADNSDQFAKGFMTAAGQELLIAEACRRSVGDGWFIVVQSSVLGQLEGLGMKRDDALIEEDNIDVQAKTFMDSQQTDYPFSGMAFDQRQAQCLNRINETRHDAELAAAKWRRAAGTN